MSFTTTAYAQGRETSTEAEQAPSRPEVPAHANGRPGTTAAEANPSLTTVSSQAPSAAQPYRLSAYRGRAARSTVTFQRLEERDGVVLEVNDERGTFRARLLDPLGKAPDEELDIDIEQLSRSDRELMVPGGLFFWAIGYLTKASGRRQLTLLIEFRRLPAATHGYAARAEERARRYMEEMNWT